MTTSMFYFQSVWQNVLQKIQTSNRVSEDAFKLYFINSQLVDITSKDQAIVVVENFISKITMSPTEIVKLIENCLEEELNKYVRITIYTKDEYYKETKEENVFINEYSKRTIDPKYTFEKFVVGASNKEAQFASLYVANNLGSLYNPLYIYGNSGLGKTHLLCSIGNQAKILNPHLRICYMSGSDFVDAVFKASKSEKLDEFKSSFNNVDLLLVDDIQFIGGSKEKTHEIFFSVFNTVINNKKQVCITSDRKPSEINGLEDRIISRFNQGLTVNINAPEYETSLNILKMKISNNTDFNQDIDEEVLSYIASNFSKDVRSLEGAITRLLFYSAINFNATNDNKITLKLAIDAFKDHISENRSELSIKQIKKVVCDYYNLTTSQITSKNRTYNITTARHIAIYLCKKILDCPYEEIGKEFGGRDHSTVMSSCKKVESEIKTNSLYLKAINDIEQKFKQ